MLSRTVLALVAAAASLGAQSGTTPKATSGDYPAHASAGKLALGAEYLGHSFSGSGITFVAPDYVVVEVALYPPSKENIAVSPAQFTLRLNGKKKTLVAQPPEFVAASLKYPDWDDRPGLEAGVGPVVVGRPAPVERFPGDPAARRRVPPQAPPPEDRSGIEKTPPPKAEEVVVQTALPEMEAHSPVSGYLYFHFSSRLKSIRSLDLVYTGEEGEIELTLPR